MPSNSLHTLAAQWKERAEHSKKLAELAHHELQGLGEQDSKAAKSAAKHATLSTSASLWAQAATELERALGEMDGG